MSLIIDSCSLINLTKAGLESTVRMDPCVTLCAGPVVCDEVWGERGRETGGVPRDLLVELPEDVDGVVLSNFMEEHRIGPGEAESILLADRLNAFFFCDDRRARAVAVELLGGDRVVGTLGLAMHRARTGRDLRGSFDDYDHARREGAYLPSHSPETFQQACDTHRQWPCNAGCVP